MKKKEKREVILLMKSNRGGKEKKIEGEFDEQNLDD